MRYGKHRNNNFGEVNLEVLLANLSVGYGEDRQSGAQEGMRKCR